MRQSLLDLGAEPPRVQRLQKRQVRNFPVHTRIYFYADTQQRNTVLELIATDRPGLLSKVGQAFGRVGIRLHDARISTIGSRAEDIFRITDRQDRPLSDDRLKKQLRDTLIELVGES
jgi:[protein-PII] uridylyltransferase